MQKMINFDDITKENIKEYNPDLPQVPDHPNRLLILGGFESGKTNSLFNLIIHKPEINRIYSYSKDKLWNKNLNTFLLQKL